MIAAKRAHDAGVISDAELERAKDDLRRWGKDRGVPTLPRPTSPPFISTVSGSAGWSQCRR